MARQPTNECGLLLIDKPSGISSFGVIHRLRKITGVRKMGHTGTIDPFATGLLPILVGRATRLNTWVTAASKTYEATVELGRRTDTGDLTGETTDTASVPALTREQLEAIIPAVLALNEQTPPAYSAVKVDGKRAYKLAREGKDVSLAPRPICIESFEILSWDAPCLQYRARVSKGVYIRVLSESIAEMLGTLGVTTALRRTTVGDLDIADSVALDNLTPDNWRESMLSPVIALGDMPRVVRSADQRRLFAQGRFLPPADAEGHCALLGEDDEMWGVGESVGGVIRPRVVLIDA